MDTICDHMTLFPWRRQRMRARSEEFVPNTCKLSKHRTECRISAAEKWPSASAQDGFALRSSPDPVLTCVLASSGFYRSTAAAAAAAAAVIRRVYRRLVAACDLYSGNIQSAGPLPNLFTNDETIKTGSHISSQRLYFFEKLRLSAGDGWCFKVTALFYDCY